MMRIVHISEPKPVKRLPKGTVIHIAAIKALAIARMYDRAKAQQMFPEQRNEVIELQNTLKALDNEV